ncbi:MAG: glycosyltransferase, partial [Ktedonobacteraceae bacterium]|nr:glycosyltransferase [Ktedonobacteraceae bacterium]
KEQLYQKFELRSDLPVVLLVGGGDGAGGLRTAVQAISAARLPVQLIVVTGRNRRLYALLQSTRSKLHVPAKIFGFVNNMPELMHAADVIITKAGPGTICEALACNLPIILSGFVPGQEEGNVEYIVKNKAGFLALDPESLIDTLRRLIKPGSPEMRQCVENARRISQPMAAFDIARYLLDCMKAGSARESWQSAHWQLRKRMLSGRLQSSFRLHRLQPRFPKPLLKSPLKNRPLLPGMRKSDRQSG